MSLADRSLSGLVLYIIGLSVSALSPNIPQDQRPFIVLAISIIVLGAHFGYSYIHSRKLEEAVADETVEALIQSLIYDYKLNLGMNCHLRANVMVPVEYRPILGKIPWFDLGDRQLTFKNDIGTYSGAELEQTYGLGEGCCGMSWDEKDMIIYDSEEEQEPEEEMSDTQLEITSHVNSIMSEPVFKNSSNKEELLFVLNVDSEDNIGRTRFDDVKIQTKAEHRAKLIRRHLLNIQS